MVKKSLSQKLDAAIDTFAQEYASCCNNAPRLPKVPNNYHFITPEGLKQEAYDVAPMNKLSIAAEGRLLEGRLKRLGVLHRKALEFQFIHMHEYDRLDKINKMFNYLSLFISSVTSVILFVFPTPLWSSKTSAASTIIVGLIVSYCRFQGLEARVEGHLITGTDFGNLTAEMSAFLATIPPDKFEPGLLDKIKEDVRQAQLVGQGADESDFHGPGDAPSQSPAEANAAATAVSSTEHAPAKFGSAAMLESFSSVSCHPEADDPDKNAVLQDLYHKAIDYRIAHDTRGRLTSMYSKILGFAAMLFSGLVQLLLAMGNTFVLKTAAAVLSLSITAVNAIAAWGNFDGKTQGHKVAMRDFSSLQWDIATVLLGATRIEEDEQFGSLTVQFRNAFLSMPAIDQKWLRKQRDSDGKPLFQFIDDRACNNSEVLLSPADKRASSFSLKIDKEEKRKSQKLRKVQTSNRSTMTRSIIRRAVDDDDDDETELPSPQSVLLSGHDE